MVGLTMELFVDVILVTSIFPLKLFGNVGAVNTGL
jgi:hypothetical protein